MPSTEFLLLAEEQHEFARSVAARWPEVRWIADISKRGGCEVLEAQEWTLRLTSVDEITSWDFVQESDGRTVFWLWHPELGPGPPTLPAYGRCWFDPAEAGTVEWDPSVVYARTAPDPTERMQALLPGRLAMNKKSDYEYVGFVKYTELREFYGQLSRVLRKLCDRKVSCRAVRSFVEGCTFRFPFRYTGIHVGRKLWGAYREGRAPVPVAHGGYQLELYTGDFATPM